MQKLLSLILFATLSFSAYSQCANFSITSDKTSVCAPELVTFSVQNAVAGSSYEWNLGDGWNTGSQTVVSLFDMADTLDISVRITLPSGTVCTLVEQDMINVRSKPQAIIELENAILCHGAGEMEFTDISPTSVSRNWIIDGTNYTNTGQTISHQFSTIGAKSISLVVTDSFGCQGVTEHIDTIRVYPEPNFNFKSDLTKGCVPQTVRVEATEDSSLAFDTDFTWLLEGTSQDSIQGLKTGPLTYTTAGTYDVALRMDVSNGCTYKLLKEDYLKFGDEVDMDLSIGNTAVCINSSIPIRLDQTGLQGTVNWEFSGIAHTDEVTDDYNHKLFPQETGNLQIKVKHTYHGCTTTATQNIAVVTKFVNANFHSEDNFHCLVPHTVHLDNNSSSSDTESISYQWNIFSNGISVHQAMTVNDSMSFFSMPAYYDVQLIATSDNGCTDTLFKKGFIYQDSMVVDFIAKPEIACIGQEVKYLNKTKPSSYLAADAFHWTFYHLDGSIKDTSNETSPTVIYADTGIYSARLIGYNSLGCTDTLEMERVEVIDPQIDFEVSDSVFCYGEQFTATARTTPDIVSMKHRWTLVHISSGKEQVFEGKTVAIKPKNRGIHTLTYSFQILDGCYREKSMNIYVNGIEGEILVDSMQACAPFAFTPQFQILNNFHYGSLNTDLDYNWSVNPSAHALLSQANTSEPTVVLQSDGFYDLNLKVQNAAWCEASFELKKIQAGVVAQLAVLDKTICLGDTLLVKNKSKNTNADYQYIIPGYSNFSTFPRGKKDGLLVADSGQFSLSLIASKDGRCADTATLPFRVIQVIADFASNDTFLRCAPVYVQFQNQSINSDSLHWDFGDGKTYTTTASSAGTIYQKNTGLNDGFDVTLIARNKAGCADTLIKENFIQVQGPQPKFTMQDYMACEHTEVKFTDLSQGGDHFVIDYGDGSPLDSVLHTHSYTKITGDAIETFYPTLFVSDNNGCVAEYKSEVAVTLYRNPEASFTLPDLSSCAPVILTTKNSTTDANSSEWLLDGSWTSDQGELELLFEHAGEHELTLITSNSYGCFDSLTKSYEIQGTPEIEIGMNDSICLFNTLNFQAIVHADKLDTTGLWMQWNFGEADDPNNTIEQQSNPFFVYTKEGHKVVTLTIVTSNGCKDSTHLDLQFRGSEDLDQPQLNYLTFLDGYTLEMDHETTNDPHFASYQYSRSDGATYESAVQKQSVWIDEFTSRPDSSLCYDINVEDICGLEGVKSRKHCFIYLTVNSTQDFKNELNWTHYIGWDEIAQYRIYRSEDGSSAFQLIGAVAASQNNYMDKGLCSHAYTYYVQAVNAKGDEKSNSFKVSQTPNTRTNEYKSSIANASVVAADQIEVRWNSSAFEQFEYFVLNKYEENTSQLMESTVLTDTFLVDFNVQTTNHSYIYTVQEVDACGEYNESERMGKTVLLEAAYNNSVHQSNLNWTAYHEWENGVQQYLVYLHSETGDEIVGSTPGTTTQFTDEAFHITLDGSYCYRIAAVNEHGDTSLSNTVCVEGDPISYIPNAFSPNNDGLNDRFKPITRFVDHEADVSGFQMEIYNTWGQLIYQSNDLMNGWDGTFMNAPCQQGAYIYKIHYRGVNNRQYNHKGTVSLLR